MRGGFLHNHVLLDPIEAHFRGLGASTAREHLVRSAAFAGFIDLFIQHGAHRIACEAELTPERIDRDLRKAELAQATLLLIVVPHRRVAQSVLRKLNRSYLPYPPAGVWVLPLGPAIERLARCFPFISPVNAEKNQITEGPSHRAGDAPHENEGPLESRCRRPAFPTSAGHGNWQWGAHPGLADRFAPERLQCRFLARRPDEPLCTRFECSAHRRRREASQPIKRFR